jgi:phenylalanyl-tRNA synthetase alpha chain
MLNEINELFEKIKNIQISNSKELEDFRLTYLSKKGHINCLFEDFRNVAPEIKKEVGKPLNSLKKEAELLFETFKEQLENSESQDDDNFDKSLPVYLNQPGSIHPIKSVENRLIEIFNSLGFDLSEGPEIEDDWHNFGALNFDEDHPARDMQDTFFIGKDVLRTHTSSVQIREMMNQQPPFRLIMPGRVYRNEAVSSRSNCFFHQLEGLYVDEGVTFADLKQTLYYFVQQFFGEGTQVRFRSSYFPFTEPSAEMDIWVGLNSPEDERLTKGTGWLEVLGCGMVHPNVLKNCGINEKKYTGYAFGMGLDRMTMLKYGISDIRDMFLNDLRLLSQFKGL